MRASIAEVMINIVAKTRKLFGQHLFFVFNSAAKDSIWIDNCADCRWQRRGSRFDAWCHFADKKSVERPYAQACSGGDRIHWWQTSLSCHPIFNTATSHDACSAVFLQKTTVSPHWHKNCGVEHRQMGKPSLQGISWGSMSVQPDFNLLLTPWKMTSCYFQAISGVFLRVNGARHYGEALRHVAAADAGRCAFALWYLQIFRSNWQDFFRGST